MSSLRIEPIRRRLLLKLASWQAIGRSLASYRKIWTPYAPWLWCASGDAADSRTAVDLVDVMGVLGGDSNEQRVGLPRAIRFGDRVFKFEITIVPYPARPQGSSVAGHGARDAPLTLPKVARPTSRWLGAVTRLRSATLPCPGALPFPLFLIPLTGR